MNLESNLKMIISDSTGEDHGESSANDQEVEKQPKKAAAKNQKSKRGAKKWVFLRIWLIFQQIRKTVFVEEILSYNLSLHVPLEFESEIKIQTIL